MPQTDHYFATDDGLKLFYRRHHSSRSHARSGKSPTILCLPGLTRSHLDFENMAILLGEQLPGYRILCPDMRGRGKSEHDRDPSHYNIPQYISDVWQLLDHEKLESVTIIGTSLGGIIAMAMWHEAPQRIDKIVLNDIGTEVSREALQTIVDYVGAAKPADDWAQAIAAVQRINASTFTDLSENEWQAFTKRLYEEQADGSIQPRYDLKLGTQLSTEPVDMWPLFEPMQLPMLLLRGANSELLPAAICDQMRERKPDMGFAEIPHRGHAPFLDEPDAIQALQAFLQPAAQSPA